MELYAKIITDDKRFERMLSLELSDCGVAIISDIDRCCQKLTPDNFITVVDFDFCREDITELCNSSKVIGFSHLYRSELGKKAESCHAFFQRPFLVSDFLSAVFSDIGDSNRIQNVREKRSSRSAHAKKKEYLVLNPERKSVVFGQEDILLTENEFKIIFCLYEKRGETVSREELSAVLGSGEGNICDVYICMLRRKLDNRFGLKILLTVRGKGYMMR